MKKSELYEYASKGKSLSYLPLMHTTDGISFIRNISKDEALKPQMCNYFDEKLIYLFYGRPAYQVISKDENYSDKDLFPICFILKPDKFETVKRIFPFDTGGYFEGVYDEIFNPLDKYMDKKGKIDNCDNFFLGSNLSIAAKFVSRVFGNNESYFYGEYLQQKFDYYEECLTKYYNLLIQTGNPKADDRKYTVEIQVDKKIELMNNIIAIIMPRIAYNSPVVRDLLEKWNVIGLHYCSIHSPNGRVLHGALLQKVEQFLRENDYFE